MDLMGSGSTPEPKDRDETDGLVNDFAYLTVCLRVGGDRGWTRTNDTGIMSP